MCRSDERALVVDGKAGVMNATHILAVCDEFPLSLGNFVDEARMPHGDLSINGSGCTQAKGVEHSHDAINADAQTVIAAAEVPQIRVNRRQRSEGAERLGCGIEWEEFNRNDDP